MQAFRIESSPRRMPRSAQIDNPHAEINMFYNQYVIFYNSGLDTISAETMSELAPGDGVGDRVARRFADALSSH